MMQPIDSGAHAVDGSGCVTLLVMPLGMHGGALGSGLGGEAGRGGGSGGGGDGDRPRTYALERWSGSVAVPPG